MIAFPNAKINLGLRVLRKRSDGYHDIETVFLPVALSDILEIVPRSSFATSSYERKMQSSRFLYVEELKSGDFFVERGLLTSSVAEKNSVFRVISLLRQEGYSIPPLYVDLYKLIPHGAGLGGGSSDATFALTLIDTLLKLGISRHRKESLLQQIGADCPYFLYNRPLLGTGIGTTFSSLLFSKTILGSFVTIAKPPVDISTAEAYAGVTPEETESGTLADLVEKPLEEWNTLLENDFESSIAKKYPQVTAIKSYFQDKGAYFALMSGSGSSVFALSHSPLVLDPRAEALEGCFLWQGTFLPLHQ